MFTKDSIASEKRLIESVKKYVRNLSSNVNVATITDKMVTRCVSVFNVFLSIT